MTVLKCARAKKDQVRLFTYNINDYVGNEATTFALTEKNPCSYPSPPLMFIKRHKDWKQGAFLHSSKICCLLEKLRFCLLTKQKLEHRETVPEHK